MAKETGLEQSLATALGDRIRQLRTDAQMTQEKLAELANINYKNLQDIESGRNSNPTIKTMWKIAQALKVPLTTMLDGVFPVPH